MGQLRLDLIFSDIFVVYGAGWAIASLAILLALCVLPLQRAFGVGLTFLVFLQTWIGPLYFMCSRLRWWAIGILAIRGVILVLLSERNPEESRASRVVLALLAFWAVFSSIWSDAPRYSFLVAATFVVGMLVSFVLVWRLADTTDVVGFICRWSLTVSLLLYGVSFGVAGWGLFWNDEFLILRTGIRGRFAGIFGNPNGCGVLAALLLPFVFAAPREILGRLAKLRVPVVIMLTLALLMSGSRSAAIGGIIAVGVVMLYRFRAGAAVFGGLIVTTIVTLMLATPVETIDLLDIGPADRIVRVATLSNLGDRLTLWETGWDAAMESPWIGSGWQISRILDGRDVSSALELGRVRAGTNLHNAHLQILVDLGVVGLGLFWLFGLMVGAACMRILVGRADRRNVVNVVLVASLAVMWGDSFVHGWIFSIGSPAALVFWACCALVLKEADRQAREERADAAAPATAALADPTVARPRNRWPVPSHAQG